jgi:TonB-linked SusC/RagA family outer membrane protein
MMKKRLIFVLMTLFGVLFAQSAQAQRTITGKVTNSNNDEALPGVSVVVKGTTKGTITDVDGIYSLQIPPGAINLTISSIGYTTKDVAVGVGNSLDIALDEDTKNLGEVVVTAFGISRTKKSLSYAAQDVGSDQITRSNEQNVVNALQGQVAGAMITNSSGSPGAGASIVLRGINSLDPSSNNQPLIVLDGIIISNATNVSSVLPSSGTNALAGSSEQISNTNRLADINPNDIANISILKGPAATVLYGSLAQNGAIVITSKKGVEGKPKVSFSTNYGVSNINKYPEIQTLFREGTQGRIRVNADNSVSTVKFQDFGGPIGTNPVYNNMRDLFVQGSTLTTNLSLAGGKKGFTYLISGGNSNQTGIVPTTSNIRSNLNLNTSFQAFDWLNLSASMMYSNTSNRQVNGGDKSVMSALSYHSNTFDVNDYILPDGGIKSYAGTNIDNPRWLAEFAPYTSKVNRYVGQVAADLKLFSWLSIRYQIGLDQYTDARKRLMPDGTDVGTVVKGYLVNDNIQQRQINSNLIFTIKKDITPDLKAQLLLGSSVFDSKFEELGIRGEGLVIPQFYDIKNTTNLFPLYGYGQSRLIGAFADLNLDYKGYLFLNASGRNDWTSTLPKANNSFFYPSVGVSFLFSDAFKMDENLLTYGKIRVSYAETGKGTDPYLVDSYFESAPRFPFGTTAGYRRSTTIGADNLRPERTKGTELGLEMRFFKRFGFDLTLYDQNTIDQIFRIPITNATGFSQLVANSGQINNKGIELTLNFTPIRTEDFKWDMRLNFTQNRGTVKSVAAGIDKVLVFDGAYIVNQLVPGGRVGDLYALYQMVRDSSTGQLKIGANGYPLLNSTLSKVGNALPDFMSALMNTVSYKGFSVSAQIEWKSGGDVYDMGRRNSIRNGIIKVTELRNQLVVFKGIGADGQPNTKEVEIDADNFYRSGTLWNGSSDMLLQDASWWRLRNVSVSYVLPPNLLKKTRFSNLSLTLTGNNLWLNTPFAGFDPEALQNGSGSNAYGFAGLTIPSVKSYSVGLNATF